MRLARIVLSQLERVSPTGWTELEKRTIKQCGTSATFKSIMQFLKSRGCIKKAGPKHRDPYTITEKGKLFLKEFLEKGWGVTKIIGGIDFVWQNLTQNHDARGERVPRLPIMPR